MVKTNENQIKICRNIILTAYSENDASTTRKIQKRISNTLEWDEKQFSLLSMKNECTSISSLHDDKNGTLPTKYYENWFFCNYETKLISPSKTEVIYSSCALVF